jgi:mRNA interferase RelE/StbE
MPNAPKPVETSKTATKWMRECRDAELAGRVRDKIRSLGTMPEVPGFDQIAGAKHLYRVRVGDYRIVFRYAPEEPTIRVTDIAHRKDVYRDM